MSTEAAAQLNLSLSPLFLHPDPLVMVPSTLMGSPSPQLILLKVLLHLLGDSRSGQLDHED